MTNAELDAALHAFKRWEYTDCGLAKGYLNDCSEHCTVIIALPTTTLTVQQLVAVSQVHYKVPLPSSDV
jgi:hypothetical protein